MKMRRFLAGLLSMVLTLSLLSVPAAAATVTFPDIGTHWAKSYIEEGAAAGLFEGYEDGKFHPDDMLNAASALKLCAWIAVPEPLRSQIVDAPKDSATGILFDQRLKEVSDLLSAKQTWFHKYGALCLEAGVISHDELAALISSGNLNRDLSKADFSRYLVRAMGLEGVAMGREDPHLNFADADQVPQECRQYVYLLNLYGIVIGDDHNMFLPAVSITRAVTATMLTRAQLEMKNQGISLELPRYTDYKWDAGYITEVTAGAEGSVLLSLKGTAAGDQAIVIPFAAKTYQDNRSVERTALKPGYYARVCYDKTGAVSSIRVTASDRLETTEGVLVSLTEDDVVLGGKTHALSRFTQVTAGGKVGDRSIIDCDAGYETACVVTDLLGNVISLDLKGGTREVDGILAGVDVTAGVTTMSLSSYDGSIQRLTVPATAVITAGGVSATLASGYIGRHITLRVKNDDITAISAIEVDTNSRYYQGVLRAVNTKVSPATISLGEANSTRQTTYQMSKDSVVTYNGTAAAIGTLALGSYCTIKVEGGMVERLSAWPGAAYTEGTLTARTFGDPTKLEVTRADGVVVPFEIPTSALGNIDIVRGGTAAAITQLTTGDTITVTVQYNAVSRIEAKPQSANVSGVVQSVTFNAIGVSMTLLLPDGTTKAFTAPAGVSVTQDGSVVPITNLKFGCKVAMVTSGDTVISIDIAQASASSTKLSGSVFKVNSRVSVTVLNAENIPVVVNIPNSVNVTDAATGATVSVSRLTPGDLLEIFGRYDKQEFVATTVVKVS